MTTPTRRSFLKTSALATGSTLLLAGTRSSAKVIGANDRLRIAVAGLNGRGSSHIGGWLGQENVEIAYLIDPDAKVLASADEGRSRSKTKGKFTAKGVADVREALEDKDARCHLDRHAEPLALADDDLGAPRPASTSTSRSR